MTTGLDTPLTRGEWVKGDQPLNYAASDNIGVRVADVIVGGQPAGNDERPCVIARAATSPANPQPSFGNQTPCPNGAGRFSRR